MHEEKCVIAVAFDPGQKSSNRHTKDAWTISNYDEFVAFECQMPMHFLNFASLIGSNDHYCAIAQSPSCLPCVRCALCVPQIKAAVHWFRIDYISKISNSCTIHVCRVCIGASVLIFLLFVFMFHYLVCLFDVRSFWTRGAHVQLILVIQWKRLDEWTLAHSQVRQFHAAIRSGRASARSPE